MPKIARLADERLASVNIIGRDDRCEVEICFMPIPDALIVEGVTRAVFALDASKSMVHSYGNRLFAGVPNLVQPLARGLGEDLAQHFSEPVSLIYWAVGPGGREIEEIGTYSPEEFRTADVGGPRGAWGTGTKLLPAVKHVVDYGKGASFTLGLFFTDGFIEDEEQCRDYCYKLGTQLVSADRAALFKLVIIGVGEQVDRQQLERLDDMFEGTDLEGKIDLWSSGVYGDWREVWHARGVIFGELNDTCEISSFGQVLDNHGQVLATYQDGLPGKIRFPLPRSADELIIRMKEGAEIRQPVRGTGVLLQS